MEHRGHLAYVACVAHGGSVLMDGMAALALVFPHVGKMSGTAHASVARIASVHVMGS